MASCGYEGGSTPQPLMGSETPTWVRTTGMGESEGGPLILISKGGERGGYPIWPPPPLVKGGVDTDRGMVPQHLGPNTPAYQVTIESMISQRVFIYRRVPPPGTEHPGSPAPLPSVRICPRGWGYGLGGLPPSQKQARGSVRDDSREYKVLGGSCNVGLINWTHPLR